MPRKAVRRCVDLGVVTMLGVSAAIAIYAAFALLRTLEAVGPVVAGIICIWSVVAVVVTWDVSEGVGAAWWTALGPVLGFSLVLVLVGPRVRWVYPMPHPVLLGYYSVVLSGVLACCGIGVTRVVRRSSGGRLSELRGDWWLVIGGAVGVGGAILGLPQGLWWPMPAVAGAGIGISVVAVLGVLLRLRGNGLAMDV